MADIVDSQTRSRMMAGVKGKNTKPEILVRKFLHRKGLRFRLHKKGLPGKPDLVFPSRKIALFVHGCFWHRHEGCAKATTPSTNVPFWEKKFSDNVTRDRRVVTELEQLGWKVIVIWECQLNDNELNKLAESIKGVSL
ncbi:MULTISPECIES: very short patch repair endonuclease [unclassified Maridesulfovibrio]|uniref:very short patch repair endonuclease n=1 Tax=unclassified Maridesulfovibrio TaxID=2794999 RepID=UPI003B420675